MFVVTDCKFFPFVLSDVGSCRTSADLAAVIFASASGHQIFNEINTKTSLLVCD